MTLILTSNVRIIRTSPPNSFKPADFVQNPNNKTSETIGKLHERAMGTPEKHVVNAHTTQSNGLIWARTTEGELWGGTQLSRKKNN